MSNLRYFADTMHRQIEIERNARDYLRKCRIERTEAINTVSKTEALSHNMLMANEGICAVRIIMGQSS